ncbi:hypothetical protein FA95DRAFT_1555078 [Auriscalpium vulgare]|uniref:Uncharacterized protein n=1 Tax=Auriscalpium vulgare TaxID=40419 RepID=A0ACB8S3X4_9AGAM|nr:hypothetical protein FA95DRAFT_1555078 [Auriscalpium vulgare]
MAVLSLPLSFTNSFWSQDYRKGLEVLYAKLEQGTAENDEVVASIRARADAEGNIAAALTHNAGPGPPGTGFSADDGATLLMAFRGLQAETAAQGEAHKAIAHELHTLVADPFEQWAKGHKDRLLASKGAMVDGYVRSYEHSQAEVIKLKNQYLSKIRKADEAEDDAKFAPGTQVNSDKYTTSPRLAPSDRPTPVRGASISERIAQRLKDIQRKTANATAAPPAPPKDEVELLFPPPEPKVDKGKGKAVDPEPEISSSPPPLSPPLPPSKLTIPTSSSPMPPEPPQPILLAGLSLPPSAISDLLTRASADLKLHPVRFPILGEYQVFNGEEFVAWLVNNVEALGGSLDRAEDAARELTERDGLLRRIGELGNSFEASDEAYFQFRQKAFELGKAPAVGPLSPSKVSTPVDLLKRSNNFLTVVSKALSTNPTGEPPHVRARADADEADRSYRIAVRKLDRQRLGLEERIEDTLKLLQTWETDRLRAVKTVLLQYHGTLLNLPKAFQASLERENSHIAAYLPESDLSALIERYRTGPFRPHPQVYESVAHDEPDVLFGLDLRKWAEGGWGTVVNGEEKKDLVPPVLTTLLDGLTEAYKQLPNDDEKRRAWIYEVPLPGIHHLRESLNAVPSDQAIPDDITTKYDAPVVASTVKLWMLELDPPLALYESWDDLKRLYPTVGSAAAAERDPETEKQHLESLKSALVRLPKVHLYVLDAVVGHLRNLIDTTKASESDEVYVTKLALSVGRTILRPKFETGVSIQDRHHAMLFIDLVKYYSEILPPTIAKKNTETERKIPLRKRTALVDLRMSRSRLSAGSDARDWLAAQRASGKVPPPVPPVPPIPAAAPEAPAPVSEEPESITEPIEQPQPTEQPAEQPAPPPVVAPTPVRASVPPPPDPDVPARPKFKTPPPEDDDLPPRPAAFKEPSSEDAVPPRPAFASPPPEVEDEAPTTPPATVNVQPATPLRRNSGSTGTTPRAGSPRVRSPLAKTSFAERTPSPAVSEDQPLSAGRTSISRTGAGNVTRAPRGGRPPRTGGGSSVSNMVQNLNRQSVGGVPTPSSPRQTSPPGGGGGGRGRRPASIVDERRRSLQGANARGAFSRRTMDSDAEDGLLG